MNWDRDMTAKPNSSLHTILRSSKDLSDGGNELY